MIPALYPSIDGKLGTRRVVHVATAPVDPNWLLSTTAVASAALVAIIGGLLVSRVISIASERQALLRRARTLLELQQSRAAQANAIRRTRLSAAQYVFAEHHVERVLLDGIADVAMLLDEFFPAGGERQDLEAVGPQIIATMVKARDQIDDAAKKSGQFSASASGLREMGLTFPTEEEWIYVVVAEELARQARRSYLGVIPITPPQGRTFRDIQDERESDEDEVRAQIAALAAEQDAVEREADRLKNIPRGVIQGIVVLAIFGIIGILLPLYEMTKRPIQAGPGTRMLVFLAFVVGFVILVSYLLWAVFVMPRDDGGSAARRQSNPRFGAKDSISGP